MCGAFSERLRALVCDGALSDLGLPGAAGVGDRLPDASSSMAAMAALAWASCATVIEWHARLVVLDGVEHLAFSQPRGWFCPPARRHPDWIEWKRRGSGFMTSLSSPEPAGSPTPSWTSSPRVGAHGQRRVEARRQAPAPATPGSHARSGCGRAETIPTASNELRMQSTSPVSSDRTATSG